MVQTPQRPPAGKAAAGPAPSFNFLMILLIFAGAGSVIAAGIGSGRGLAFVFVMASWVLSLCLHEFGHAYVAWKGGDDEIAGTGYLSLDPRLYIDPFGSIILPILFTLFGGFGFPGGAVFVNRERLRTSAWRSAMSAAGPAMNGLFLLFLLALYGLANDTSDTLHAVLAVAGFYQATAIVLNLLPIPGLDGYGILRPWLPSSLAEPGDRIARYSGLVVTGLFLFSGAFSRIVFRAGLSLVAGLGFVPQDVVAGYRLMRLW